MRGLYIFSFVDDELYRWETVLEIQNDWNLSGKEIFAVQAADATGKSVRKRPGVVRSRLAER